MKKTIVVVGLVLGLFAAPVTGAFAQVSAPPEQFTPKTSDDQRNQVTAPAQPNHAGRMMNQAHKASDIIGKTVRSSQGEDLGMVEDMVVGNDGRIQFAILSRSGGPGMGERLVPVPWRFITLNPRDGAFSANLDKTLLDKAPNFSSANWPDLSRPEWQKSVFSYYDSQTPASEKIEDLGTSPEAASPGSDPATQSGPPAGTETEGSDSRY